MKSRQYLKIESIRLYTAILSILFIMSVYFTGCSKVENSQKIKVPALDVIREMKENLDDFNGTSIMSYDDTPYSTNLSTLYKGLKESDITDGCIAFDETGNTADEISILVAPDTDSTSKLKTILKQRAEKRAEDFGKYKPEESIKAQEAHVTICDRYVMLAIGKDSLEMQKQFQLVMQKYSNIKDE